MKNMGRDHVVLIERTKEAEQVAQKIEVDSIQSKMLLVSPAVLLYVWCHLSRGRVMNKISTS